MSLPYFKRAIRPLVPVDGIAESDLPGKPHLYHGRKTLDAWFDDRVSKMRVAAVGTDGKTVAGELLGGKTTPALEQFRRVRTQMEEFRLQREQGYWIRREEIHIGFGILASILRTAGEELQRQFGQAAYAIIDSALNDGEREIVSRVPPVIDKSGVAE